MLQNPGTDSVRVVWFSEVADGTHTVRVGDRFQNTFVATTTRMSRLLEDSGSQVFQRITSGLTTPQARVVYRHEAVVTGLNAGRRTPYVAITEFSGHAFRSGTYTLQPLPYVGQPLRFLLTSDQQNNPMSLANYQKALETVGSIDAVLFPGDLVSQPNRASEWFDRSALNNPSFFQALQGTMRRWNPAAVFKGGEILQQAPLFGCLGNHEYPGRWRLDPQTNNPANPLAVSINNMDNDPQPLWYAKQRYEALKATVNPSNDAALRDKWVRDNSFEYVTYEEMWSLPEGPEGKAYYAVRFGDVFIISLDANRPWRTFNPNQRGKFSEEADGATRINQNADGWGFGDFTFRPFARGSTQFQWLENTLRSDACRTAKYRIVLSHQTMAGLGDNGVPVQAEQRVTVELNSGQSIGPFQASEFPARWPEIASALGASSVRYVRYEYPLAEDQWRNDIEPLLLAHGVHLVHTGHSHLWNRCKVGNLNYLETSNVGNSFGAMYFATSQPGVSPTQGPRPTQPGNAAWRANTVLGSAPRTRLEWNPDDYPTFGDPHGRTMIMPTLANPMRQFEGRPHDLPFVASNALTAFSTFESANGRVSSYVFDTRQEDGPVTKFDEFSIV